MVEIAAAKRRFVMHLRAEDVHEAIVKDERDREVGDGERERQVGDGELESQVTLEAVALADIADQLRAPRELAGRSDPDPGRVGLALRDLVARFSDLAENAQVFMG